MRSRRVESPRNHAVREAIDIAQRRSRYRHRAFIVEGTRALESAMKAGASISRVFFAGPQKKPQQSLLRKLDRSGAECLEATEHIISKIADTESPQAMLAVASMEPAELDTVETEGPVVVIDGIADPGNLGSIIRTADAAGCSAVVLLEGTCDAFSPKALRATAGSIFNIPIVYEKRADVAKSLKKKNLAIAVSEARGGESIFDTDLLGSLAVVFGNEARGASRQLRQAADVSLHIPIAGEAESLNVAQAAAVVLYEALRQRTSL